MEGEAELLVARTRLSPGPYSVLNLSVSLSSFNSLFRWRWRLCWCCLCWHGRRRLRRDIPCAIGGSIWCVKSRLSHSFITFWAVVVVLLVAHSLRGLESYWGCGPVAAVGDLAIWSFSPHFFGGCAGGGGVVLGDLEGGGGGDFGGG